MNMLKTITRSLLLTVFGLFLFASCQKNDGGPAENIPDMEKLNIPADFDYSTTGHIELTINDGENGAKYDIYSLKSNEPEEVIYTNEDTVVVMDDMNTKLASGMVQNGSLQLSIVVPAYHHYLYIVRSKEGNFYRESMRVTGTRMSFNYSGFKSGVSSSSGRYAADDMIYIVNGSDKKFYQLDMGSYEITEVDAIPYSSFAVAVDAVDQRVYIANRKAPYQLGYYDLNTGTFTIVGNGYTSIPRMDYNENDGLLYISKLASLYTVDPSNGQYLQTFTIQGIDDVAWGDLAFASDGTLYILSNSGIYKGEINGNNVNCVEVSDNTLPKELTSLAVGSNGKLYTVGSKIKNKIIEFDPSDGSWSYIPVNGKIKANDFGILRSQSSGGNDSDGDGVPDGQDDYPNDPERAFNNYFPGEGLWGTLAFEDLWPSKGDYDFNDMVTGYNINQVTSAENKVVDIIAKFDVRHNGAGLHNGFAFQVPVDQASIASVTSDYQYLGNIPLNGNGTIAGQDLANILVFEDNDGIVGQEINVTVHFATPVPSVNAGNPPYNAYLLKDGDQSVEIHLPDSFPTRLADVALFGTEDDTSDPATGRYYKTEKNLPWAINIVYDFEWMKEKVEIVNGYLHFAEWAESGGTQYQDWYKDLPGYRNESLIDN
jgi:LruC domain-containing protein